MNGSDFKLNCIALRHQGFTLPEIVKKLGRPKTTIYSHIKDIPKSNFLLEKIRASSAKTAKRVRPKKGISLLNRHPKKFNTWAPELVNLFAHVLFDGSIRPSGVVYHNRSNALLNNFKEKMKYVYDFPPNFYRDRTGVMRIAYHNVEIASFFKEKTTELGSRISLMSRKYQREFLKAFFDDEGSIDFRKKIRRVRGYQHNKKILSLIQELLANFGIESKVDACFNEIIISRRENIKKFAKEINFSKGIRVNGKRSNSIWKKSLEKRKILAMALSSYQTSP